MGLVIVIEPHGTYAIYEQIVNQIKNQIISGELQPDEALPSIRGLAADIGVSVITTKHAYEELEREGLIRLLPDEGQAERAEQQHLCGTALCTGRPEGPEGSAGGH